MAADLGGYQQCYNILEIFYGCYGDGIKKHTVLCMMEWKKNKRDQVMVMVPALAIFRSSIPCFCSISVFAVSRLLTCPINYTLILGCSMPSQNVFPPVEQYLQKQKGKK